MHDDIAASAILNSSATNNNDLNYIVPTELVTIPSKGIFYPKGHPVYGKEEIEIRFMKAADENILTSKSLLKQGVAIDRFLQGIIIDPNIKVDDLLIGDKNALVVAARISGYGSDYETKVNCSACGNSFTYVFNLKEASENLNYGKFEELGLTVTDDNTFIIELPKTFFKVECKLLTGKDEKSLLFRKKALKKHNIQQNNLTDYMKLYIVSINGNTNNNDISQCIENNLPAFDSKFLRSTYKNAVPNIDLKEEVICEVCENVQEIDIPFTADFFWPDR
jgi:hypothetical protein